MKPTRTLAILAGSSLLLALSLAAPSSAAGRDSDHDGIPNRWERAHGMNPHKKSDARADFDKDGLSNRAEYRHHTKLRDEDTDNDGADDGDEVHDGSASTNVRDADTDNDGRLDGDEDADRDGITNEDEDDATETCARADDDVDHDHVADEDENELGLTVGDADSDNDGITDGSEDRDHDGEANEDEDDAVGDACDDSSEDVGDLLGTIAGYDAGTGALTVTTVGGGTITETVTGDTRIKFEHVDGTPDPGTASTADLLPGAQVAELEVNDKTGSLEKVSLYPAV
jgi:hypothetical protein